MLKFLTLIEIIHTSLFIFVSVWFAFIFLVEESFSRQAEAITLYYLSSSMVHFLFISTRFILQDVQFFILIGALFYFIRLSSYIFGKFN